MLVFGLLFLLALTVLFVPVRYEGKIAGDISEPDEIKGCARVSYFFRLFQIRLFFIKKKLRVEIRIAWKKIGQAKEAEEEDPPEIGHGEIPAQSRPETEKEDRKTAALEEREIPEIKRQEEKEKEEKNKEKEEKNKEAKKKAGKKEKKKSGFPKKNIFERISYTFGKICDKIKAFSEKKDRVMEMLRDETHQKAFRKGKTVCFALLKAWKPEKVKGEIMFGFEEPYYTGKILAYLAMLYPFFGEWLKVTPDFEKRVLKGNLHIKGHMRMNHAAIALVRLVLDKNIRSTGKEILTLFRR